MTLFQGVLSGKSAQQTGSTKHRESKDCYLDRIFERSALHLSGQLFVQPISLLLLANHFLLHLQLLLLRQLGRSLLAALRNLVTNTHQTLSNMPNIIHQRSSGHQAIWSQTHIKLYPSAVFRTSNHLVTNTHQTLSISSLQNIKPSGHKHMRNIHQVFRTSSHLVTNTHQTVSTNSLQDIKPSGHKHTSNSIHQQSTGHQTIWSQTHIKQYPPTVYRTSSHLVTNTHQTVSTNTLQDIKPSGHKRTSNSIHQQSTGHQAIWSQTHIKQYPPTIYRTSSHLVTNTHQTVSTNSLQDIKPSGHKRTSNSIHQQSTGHQAIWSQTHIKQYPPTVYRTSSHLVTNTHQTVSTNSLQDIKPSGHKRTSNSIHQQSTGHQAIWSQTHIKQYPPTVYRTSSHLVTNAHQTVSTNSLQDIKPYGKVLLVHLQETMRHLA